MDVLDAITTAVLNRLASVTDLVVYGSIALTAGFVYCVAFFGIVGTFYRTTNPLVPPLRALSATLIMLSPLALVLVALNAAGGGDDLLPSLFTYSPLRMVAFLLGTPALLLLPATALCRYQPFRDLHMAAPPVPPSAAAAATLAAPAGSAVSSAGRGAAPAPVDWAAAEPSGPPASKKED